MASAFLFVSIYSTLWNHALQFSSWQTMKMSSSFSPAQRAMRGRAFGTRNTKKPLQLQKAAIAPGSILLSRNLG